MKMVVVKAISSTIAFLHQQHFIPFTNITFITQEHKVSLTEFTPLLRAAYWRWAGIF